MKILLAIDASPFACEAIAKVQRMFGGSGATVVVVSVIGSRELEPATNPVMLASVAQNLKVLEDCQVRKYQEIVEQAAQTLSEAGLNAVGEVEYGDPRHVLVSLARSHGADLLVVGSHTHSAAQRLIMGSTSSYVVNHAPCDVLVVSHVKNKVRD